MLVSWRRNSRCADVPASRDKNMRRHLDSIAVILSVVAAARSKAAMQSNDRWSAIRGTCLEGILTMQRTHLALPRRTSATTELCVASDLLLRLWQDWQHGAAYGCGIVSQFDIEQGSVRTGNA
jgi:hypothetical protein